jgi:hypothetical protein
VVETEPSAQDGGAQDGAQPGARPHPLSAALQNCSQKKAELKTIADAVLRFNALAPTTESPPPTSKVWQATMGFITC